MTRRIHVKLRGIPCLLASLVLEAAALLLGSASATAQPARAERPTYSAGDPWVLTDASYRLARVERDAYVFTAPGDREIWLTRDIAVTFVKRGGETLEIQGVPRPSWPLQPGKRGLGRAIIRVAGVDIEVYATWRVEAAEAVRVTAVHPAR
jgi:hypothetical protein